MKKVKLALVSYINTIPFIEAIKSSESLNNTIELVVDYPAKCAELIRTKQVDGGLLPLGALYENPDLQIVTNYCIGANGAVDTVAVFSHQPLEQCQTIYLDYQSRTSVQLIQILAQQYWKKKFTFLPTQKGFEESTPSEAAVLLIGDRVFEFETNYKYKTDLAAEWKKYTHLPFVFALWVGNDKLKNIEHDLNSYFAKSLTNIPALYSDLLTIDKDIFVDYLSSKIDYILDDKKLQAIRLFSDLLKHR